MTHNEIMSLPSRDYATPGHTSLGKFKARGSHASPDAIGGYYGISWYSAFEDPETGERYKVYRIDGVYRSRGPYRFVCHLCGSDSNDADLCDAPGQPEGTYICYGGCRRQLEETGASRSSICIGCAGDGDAVLCDRYRGLQQIAGNGTCYHMKRGRR